MPGWRRLLRAALSLLLAPAVWSLIIGIATAYVAWRKGMTFGILDAAIETYPYLAIASLAVLIPVLGALLRLRALTVFRVMLWSALASGAAWIIWSLIQIVAIDHVMPAWGSLAYQSAIAVIFGFFNGGLFALLAAIWRWPAARSA